MYDSYLYPLGRSGDIPATLVGIPGGVYDVYVYGHGAINAENGVYELSTGPLTLGPVDTTSESGWSEAAWQEGPQYVVFRSVIVAVGQPMTLTAKPGVSGLAVLNGVQLVWREAGSPPETSVQPRDRALREGDRLVLQIEAIGPSPLDYRLHRQSQRRHRELPRGRRRQPGSPSVRAFRRPIGRPATDRRRPAHQGPGGRLE